MTTMFNFSCSGRGGQPRVASLVSAPLSSAPTARGRCPSTVANVGEAETERQRESDGAE